jgi:hypothetical protein
LKALLSLKKGPQKIPHNIATKLKEGGLIVGDYVEWELTPFGRGVLYEIERTGIKAQTKRLELYIR